ncbi:UNVERIFIED_CONTAM: hypothetical protein K2H54_038964 [Gekko kuhli]
MAWSVSGQQAGEEKEIENVPQAAWKQLLMVWTTVGESGDDMIYSPSPSPTADVASSTALMSTSGMMRTKMAYAAEEALNVVLALFWAKQMVIDLETVGAGSPAQPPLVTWVV